VNQGQTNDKAGFMFAKGLRCCARIPTSSWWVKSGISRRSKPRSRHR
jgi:hypothetical protein